METVELEKLQPVPSRTKRKVKKKSNLPRMFVLLGIFAILLYLYFSLTNAPRAKDEAAPIGIKPIFSIYGWGKQRLDSPNSVAVGPRGNIYISDTGNHRIAVFNSNGKFQFAIGEKAKKPENQPKKGPLLFPLGLSVAPNGDISVASMERSLVLVFDRRGRVKHQIRVDKPIDVVNRGDDITVASAGGISIFSADGKKKSEWGKSGRAIGSFLYPNGLAYDRDGMLFVSDTQNSRIQILKPNGEVAGVAGKPPKDLNDSDRMFGLNMGLAIDDQQRVYIVDAFHHSIHIFTHDGDKINEIGKQGELEGEFNYPSDIAYLGGGRFAIADKWNDRIQVVRINIPTAVTAKERAGSIYPYIILILLILLLLYLSWRQRRSERAGAPARPDEMPPPAVP